MTMTEEELRYPIGKFVAKENYTSDELREAIRKIETLPARLEEASRNLSDFQLDTPYRPDGWTLRQVLHHVPDSHSNAYIRFKWALTEDAPLIKAYNEKAWALTPETALSPKMSIDVLKALHIKWVTLMKSLSNEQLKRAYIHPDTGKLNRLDNMIAMYAWHGDHHLGHIESLKKRMGW